MSRNIFKETSLSPRAISAGDSAEFIIRLIAGPDFTKEKSRIIFDFPGTLGMSRPGLMHQEESGFVQVYVSNPETGYQLRVWDMEIADFISREKRSWREMAARLAVLDLDGGIKEGDVLELRWGDASGGFGPGTKVTSVVPRRKFECRVHVRYFESHEDGLPDFGRSFKGYERPAPVCEAALPFRVLPRPASRLRLLRKTDRALLIPHDIYCNVAEDIPLDELVETAAAPSQNELGVYQFADKNVQVAARKLPLRQTPAMDNVFEGYNLYWGDLHTHSAFSNDCVEREKMDMRPGDLMAFARQRAGLDFHAVTDHHQPWDIERNKIGRDCWEETIESAREHDRAGEFLVFPGIEFRCRRGDTVVLFNGFPEYKEIDRPEWRDIREVWKALPGNDFLTIPHFHNPGGLEPDEWWERLAGGIEPVLEIFSCHGSYERADALEHRIPLSKHARPDRYGAYFLRRGLRYGLVCNSDGHKGHAGMNGVTAVFAKSLDKNALLEACRQRRVYGTTNARIRLIFTGNGQLMGSIVPNASEKRLFIDVTGEGPLKKVEIFRNAELWRRFAPEGLTFQTELAVREDDPSFWNVRVTQTDNHIAFSSPLWFE